MAIELERKVKYVDVVESNGRTVTHMIFEDMGKFSKKKYGKTTTKVVNGKMITEVELDK